MSLDPPVAPVAPAAGPAPAGWTYPPTPLGRIGLGVCALGALLMLFATQSAVVSGHSESGAQVTYGLKNDIIAYGVVLLILLAFAAAVPWVWARLAGVTLGAGLAGFLALGVLGARTSNDFAKGSEVSLEGSGIVLVVSFLLVAVGVALALAGFRRPAPAGPPQPAGGPVVGKAVASLVLGLVGLIIAPLGALAVAFSLLARDDIALSGGSRGGRGLAVAGLVLGIIALVGWGLGLGLGMLFANP